MCKTCSNAVVAGIRIQYVRLVGIRGKNVVKNLESLNWIFTYNNIHIGSVCHRSRYTASEMMAMGSRFYLNLFK